MNKIINGLIDRIVNLEIENKALFKSEINYQNKLSAAEDIIRTLKQQITNMRLGIDELQKEKDSN